MRYLHGLALRVFWKMDNETSRLNYLTGQILNASIIVHSEMGPGLLESVYQVCLLDELRSREILVETQVPVSLHFKGKRLNKDYVIDILVENEIVVELKAIEALLPIHDAQLLSYLKLSNKKIGLLINFNVTYLKHGFRRFVNNF
jgi:GxxExxY protein